MARRTPALVFMIGLTVFVVRFALAVAVWMYWLTGAIGA